MKTIVLITMIVVMLTSCTYNSTHVISSELNKAEELIMIYGIEVTDLAARSKCETPPTVKIVNTDEKTNDILYYFWWPTRAYINPNLLMNGTVNYINDAFRRSGINTDQNSEKIINVSMVNTGAWYTIFNFSADTQIKLQIPEKKYTRIFKHIDSTPKSPEMAVVYTIHYITWKIINDLVVQDYLLCR